MTPTTTRLKARLDDRRRWFTNEWFFKWHFIGKDGPVSIDGFDDRGIHLGGMEFSGSARDIYWDALVRGVRNEIIDQFAWVDGQVRNYPYETALKAIDECAGQLASFVRAIRRKAVEKDRILRGNGIDFPPEDDAGWWEGTDDRDILRQAEALKAAIPAPQESREIQTSDERKWLLWDRHRFWLEPVGWVMGIIGTVAGLIAFGL